MKACLGKRFPRGRFQRESQSRQKLQLRLPCLHRQTHVCIGVFACLYVYAFMYMNTPVPACVTCVESHTGAGVFVSTQRHTQTCKSPTFIFCCFPSCFPNKSVIAGSSRPAISCYQWESHRAEVGALALAGNITPKSTIISRIHRSSCSPT